MKYYYEYETVIGKLCLVEEQQAITGLYLLSSPLNTDHRGKNSPGIATATSGECRETPIIKKAYEQLSEYFAGARKEFELPLAPQGTEFQKKVWAELQEIPYGETRSYGQIAATIGNPGAGRAVGMANHKNPLPIVVPCHRVIGAGGSLTGYAGGLDIKRTLLELEGVL